MDHPYRNMVETDEFDALYNDGLRLTGTKDNIWRRDRFFNLHSIARYIYARSVEGDIADVGVWKGLSTYLLLQSHPEVVAVDSFEGLSVPTSRDGRVAKQAGDLANSLDTFLEALSQYRKGLTVYKGWIPQVFEQIPNRQYAFVHIDVDLIDPTLSAFDYFYPRMSPGGIILFDDYASKAWENLKVETDRHLASRGVRGIALSTCQLLVLGGR